MPIKFTQFYATKISFAIATAFILFFPLLVPQVRLFYYAPFMVTCLYKHTPLSYLWRACLCGVIVDLFSSGPLFGITALNYCTISCLLAGQRSHFFEDKISTLPIMTFFFSLLSTLFALVAAPFSGTKLHLSFFWIVTDLICMPLADALYALFAFSLPFQLLSKQRIKI